MQGVSRSTFVLYANVIRPVPVMHGPVSVIGGCGATHISSSCTIYGVALNTVCWTINSINADTTTPTAPLQCIGTIRLSPRWSTSGQPRMLRTTAALILEFESHRGVIAISAKKRKVYSYWYYNMRYTSVYEYESKRQILVALVLENRHNFALNRPK